MMALRVESRIPSPDEVHVQIEPMRRRHLRQIMKTEVQVYPKPWTMGIFASELAQVPDARQYIVAKVGKHVVGYCGTLYSETDAHITNIAVDPRWQRHKIGSRLLITMIRISLARGCRNLTLEVRVSNRAAQEMYRRFGMAPAGVRRRYYENTEDAIVMWAEGIDAEEYAQRLVDIESRIPGTTTVALES
ncbi:MAG: ribosomal protein S18-alanine N-acetyltransferase [Acidimicrobiia bacterium]